MTHRADPAPDPDPGPDGDDRRVIGWVCRHENPPRTLAWRYGCPDDEPIRLGDTVVTAVTSRIEHRPGQTTRIVADTVVTVEVPR